MAGRAGADDGADKLAALHERLVIEVAALVSGDDWRRWLDVARRFPTYSFNNCLLIAAQRPDATAVAGYRAWQTMHRQVERGEKGLQILAPVTRRVPADERPKETAEDTGRRSVVGFRVTHVWDVAQTTGEPLPDRPHPTLLEGKAPQGLWDSLARVLQSRGFVLERGACGEANGWTDHLARTVRVRADIDEAQAAKTLAHEAAHVLLHGPITDEPRPTREQAEVEAESVAYIVTSVHGLTSDSYSFAYVASWATSATAADVSTAVRETAQRVLRAARDILTVTGGLQPVVVDEKVASRVAAAAAREPAPAAEIPIGRLADVNTETAAFFASALSTSEMASAALSARGVPPGAAASHMLGYAPGGWTALTDHLRGQGFTEAEMKAAGVVTGTRHGNTVDLFRDRIMFPVLQADGSHIIGFIGRALHVDERTPKYLNTPQTALYRKSDSLFGLGLPDVNRQLTAGAVPVLVEGPFDAIAVSIASETKYVGLAPSGTALTAGQVSALDAVTRLQGKPVIVAFDGDEAGRTAAVRAHDVLRPSGCQPMFARLADGEDPSSLAVARPGQLPVLLATAVPLTDAVIDARIDSWSDKLHWAEGQLGAVRSCAVIIAALDGSQVGRQVVRVAERTGVATEVVTSEVILALETSMQLRESRCAESAVAVLRHVSVSPGTSAGRVPIQSPTLVATGIHSRSR